MDPWGFESALSSKTELLIFLKNFPFTAAVRTIMGDVHCRILGTVQYFNLFLTAIAYNITGATSMQNVAETYCKPDGSGCMTKYWVFCIIFGGLQLILSQLPNMDSLWVVSAIGMLSSFFYSFVALALAIKEGNSGTSDLQGTVYDKPSDKMFAVFNAMGAIVFAYSFSFIMVEIADTVKSKDSAGRGPIFHIRRAISVAMVIITAFYIAVSVSGYAAFGNDVCGNIITCFTGTNNPVGLIRATNIFVLIHMFPGMSSTECILLAYVYPSLRMITTSILTTNTHIPILQPTRSSRSRSSSSCSRRSRISRGSRSGLPRLGSASASVPPMSRL